MIQLEGCSAEAERKESQKAGIQDELGMICIYSRSRRCQGTCEDFIQRGTGSFLYSWNILSQLSSQLLSHVIADTIMVGICYTMVVTIAL